MERGHLEQRSYQADVAWLDSGGRATRQCDGNAERRHTFGGRSDGVGASSR